MKDRLLGLKRHDQNDGAWSEKSISVAQSIKGILMLVRTTVKNSNEVSRP